MMNPPPLITDFMVMCVPDCEHEVLHLSGTTMHITWRTWQDAISRLIRKGFKSGSSDYSVMYTLGHYGDDDYLWEFERYAVYEPVKGNDRTLVILYYRPVGCKTEHVLYSKERKSLYFDENGELLPD